MSSFSPGVTSPSTALVSDQEKALELASAMLGIPTPTGSGHNSTALRLSRGKAASYLCALGYPVSANRLAKLAVYGGGPEYRTWGRRVVYCPLALLEWAQNRESAPRSHTSRAKQV